MSFHPIYEGQLNRVLSALNLSRFNNQRIFVSGGTGMIGACLLDLLSQWNRAFGGTISLIASSRNLDKIKENNNIEWISWDTAEALSLPSSVDYIFHTAGHADPVNFAQYPVETLWGAMAGTRSVLEYGRKEQCQKILYLSSGEMYGQPKDLGEDFKEDYCGAVNHATARACYPVGKRGGEVLCQSYWAEYQVPSVIARPCHIFGPTMGEGDSRATSSFIRNALLGEDIVLKSEGLMERSHCYVVDCASALLVLMELGEVGEAYNIADETYQMTIRDFAEETAKAGGTELRFELPTDTEAKGFSPVSRAVLSGEKLKALGWEACATETKGEGIKDSIEIMRQGRERP